MLEKSFGPELFAISSDFHLNIESENLHNIF